jgi:hypothetical protein
VAGCKPMWQNMRAYETINNNPCPHINAELLLMSQQDSFCYNSNISGHKLIWTFFCFVSVCGTRPKVCPHISVALCITIQLTVRRRVLENSILAQLINKFPPFMELEDLLQCSQEPATGPYPEPDQCCP